MTSFDAADMNVADDYGHPEDLVERPRSIGKRPPQVMAGGRLPPTAVTSGSEWSEARGLAALDRAAGKLDLGESYKVA